MPAPGEAIADWKHIAEVAKRLGFHGFGWQNASEVFAEHAALSGYQNNGSRDFDISALASVTTQHFDSMEPFQWPWPKDSRPEDSRFFGSGGFFTSDRKARAIAVQFSRGSANSSRYPLILNTGRIRDQWHTMTRTGLSARLSSHCAEPFCEIHPDDANALGIGEAALVELASPYGRAILRALITPHQRQGSVFAPMHWTGVQASAARIDAVVPPVIDPHSGQPALKNCRVSARTFDAAWYGFAVTAQRPKFPNCEYWVLARADGGWRMELAAISLPQEPELFASQLFGKSSDTPVLTYRDRVSGQFRVAAFDGSKLIGALFMAPEPVAVSRQLVCDFLKADFLNPAARCRVVAGRTGSDQPEKGAIICACNNVGINEINNAIVTGCISLDAIGAATNAGTNCGSCRAELSMIVSRAFQAAAE
jgi:assimilatory nitrate reductase catalytic subunit